MITPSDVATLVTDISTDAAPLFLAVMGLLVGIGLASWLRRRVLGGVSKL